MAVQFIGFSVVLATERFLRVSLLLSLSQPVVLITAFLTSGPALYLHARNRTRKGALSPLGYESEHNVSASAGSESARLPNLCPKKAEATAKQRGLKYAFRQKNSRSAKKTATNHRAHEEFVTLRLYKGGRWCTTPTPDTFVSSAVHFPSSPLFSVLVNSPRNDLAIFSTLNSRGPSAEKARSGNRAREEEGKDQYLD